MRNEDPGRREAAWQSLCVENGWACRICGVMPELGEQFEHGTCADCKLALNNAEFSNPESL